MKKISLDSLFFGFSNDYLNIYLVRQLCRSTQTVKSYKESLSCFRRYVNNVKNISITKFKMNHCDKDFVLSYIEYLRGISKSVNTINHRLSVIKNYLSYVSDKKIEYQSIYISITHIPSLKNVKKINEILTDEMLERILMMPKSNDIGRRNTIIMILLYDTAIRVSELIYLKKSQLFIDNKEPYILINGKGDKQRIVPISEHCKKYLKNYIDYTKNIACDFLFNNTIKGIASHLSESSIQRFIQNYADEARSFIPTIPLRVHPHMFRRSRATKLYQSGIGIELISRLLGHSSIDTTTIYAQISLEKLREVIIEKEIEEKNIEEWDNDDDIIKLFGLN